MLLASSGHAQDVAAPGDPSLLRLNTLATQLADPDPRVREPAAHALSHLGPEMLPAIRARIAWLRRHRPEQAWATDIFNQLRHAAGSDRADDEIDVEPGVLPVLTRSRHSRVLLMAEPILLMRSCERQHTFESISALLPIFGLDGTVWRWESRRMVNRLGDDALAAAIVARGHDDVHVRAWARLTVERLDAEDPGRTVQRLNEAQLPDVLRAYAMTHVQSAMPIIVAYVGSERRAIRRAARWSLEQYGTSAIWVLRTAYHERSGEQPPREWGWQRVSRELFARIDADRNAPAVQALEAAHAAASRGDIDALGASLDEVLSRSPEMDDTSFVGEAYARIGAARGASGRLVEAESAYRRAVRLAPNDARAPHWRAEAAFVHAQAQLARGVLDVEAYRRVLLIDPDHDGARAVLEPLVSDAPVRNRVPALAAAAMLFLFAMGLLFWRRARVVAPAPMFEDDATLPDSPVPG